MKNTKQRRFFSHFMLAAAILLVIAGVMMLGQTFTHYNSLFLARQDRQLEDMARAADENMAVQLSNLRKDLQYILGRRGFSLAEAQWEETGETADLLFRMQENLIAQNPIIHTLLAFKDGKIVLSSAGSTSFHFPAGTEGSLQPCFAGDGSMYLALIEQTQLAAYAALISMSEWYGELARVNGSEGIRLMLLGSREKILLHQWPDSAHVTAVEDLNETNCDLQAVQTLMESRSTGKSLTTTYHLTYPGETFVHEMRMTTLPLEECVNGYFIVGLTSDYDEVIRPMQAAAVKLVIYGAMVVIGVLLLMLLVIRLARQSRHRDHELQLLIKRNEETQKLLERTQELAHHQRLETIGTMTASIAHEFNNLLTPIMGYSILTLEGLPAECDDLADNVTEIYQASRKARDIIARLNALSRRGTEADFIPLSLQDLVSKALNVTAPAQPAHVTTRLQNDSGECIISGNETQLSQLLLNLILNAYHAMQEKGGTLTISLKKDSSHAILEVEDTGKGIPEEALPHIFEPFFTTKESGAGTGLGLAIVQQVVESHHGRISVDSHADAGTDFTLHFPLAISQSSAKS